MSARDLEIHNVAVEAGQEESFVVPDGTVFLEMKTRAGTAFKFAFAEGETASNFVTVPANQSWYTSNKLVFPTETTFYFLCASNETVEILLLRG